jgi:hypothetical protein
MPTDAEGTPGSVLQSGSSPGSGASGSDPGSVTLAQVNEIVNKALSARDRRISEQFTAQFAELKGLLQPAKAAQPEPNAADNSASSEKLTLKALHEQIASLNKGIEQERKARAEAEQKAVETRMRAEVQAQFARHLGADSPHLGPYVNHYLAQFQHKDGQVVRKVVGQYGEEEFLPADKGIEELFKGDLKHLVQTSKAGNLPPAGIGQLRGTPFAKALAPQANGLNPMRAEMLEAIAKDRPELAAQLAAAYAVQNGSGSK